MISSWALPVPETVVSASRDTRLMIDSLMSPVNGNIRALEIGSGSGAVTHL